MIILNTEEVRAFLRHAANVKPNVLYPALDCIKIETNPVGIMVFTKTNNNVFCQVSYQTNQAFSPILIDERAIAGLLMVADAPTITLDGQALKCGQRRVNIPVQDAKLFPNTPSPDPFIHDVPDALLAPIKIAAKYYSRNPLTTMMSLIHADERGVFSTNGNMTYHYKAEAPSVRLDEEIANVIGNLKSVKYSTAGNYDWYFNDEVSYAFIRKECPSFKYEAIFAKLQGTASFTIDKNDLQKFCNLVQFTTKQENPLAVMSGVGDTLNLIHEDHDFGSGVEDKIGMTSNEPVAPFKFNVKTLNTMLGSLPYTELTFNLCDKHYKLTSAEDANYTGILSALQN